MPSIITPIHAFNAFPIRLAFSLSSEMASSSSSAPAASSAAAAAAGCLRPSRLSFSLITASVKPLLLPTKGSRISRNRLSVAKAQSNEVGGLSNDGTATKSKTEAPPSKGEDVKSTMSEEEISAFMTQVTSLVKLVNSRDIVELQLKQLDCELIIRKKEALQQPPATAPVMMMPPAAGQYAMAPPYSPPPPAAAPSPSPTTGPSAPAPPSAPPKAKSSHPPLKSPMAGTFYRNPGPGLAPFVKPGDKVNKGQVLCIIEAMKLMNEIEADQAGTVVEILVDDGKPVGIEQPLFVIEP